MIEPAGRRSSDPHHSACRVAPLEAFSDELAPDGLADWCKLHHRRRTGPSSSTMHGVLLSNCSGYQNPPRGEELYEAMRRPVPKERDLAPRRAHRPSG